MYLKYMISCFADFFPFQVLGRSLDEMRSEISSVAD